jgi:hypothetical protein
VHVNIGGKNDVGTEIKVLQESSGSAHARGENQSALAAFEFAHRFFQPILCRVLIADIRVPMNFFAGGAMFERGGEVNRRGNSARNGIRPGACMHSFRFDFHGHNPQRNG